MSSARDVGQGTRYKGRGDEGRGPEIRITSSLNAIKVVTPP